MSTSSPTVTFDHVRSPFPQLPRHFSCPGVVYSPRCIQRHYDGIHLISGNSDGTLRVWHEPTGEVERSFRLHWTPVTGVAVCPRGQRVATIDVGRHVIVSDLESGAELMHVRTQHSPTSVAFTPDGTALLTIECLGPLKVWDLTDGGLLATHRVPPGNLESVSPCGRYALLDLGAQIDLETGEATYQGRKVTYRR